MSRFTPAKISHSTSEVIADAIRTPAFDAHYTDHLAQAVWRRGEGWTEQEIIPLGDLALHPATTALHYGQAIFEGLKAYRHADGSVWLFRPDRNAARFVDSAQRLAMEPLPAEDFLDAVTELVKLDAAWVPEGVGEQSLYLRPLEFASQLAVAPHESAEYRFLVMATPAGRYYPKPVRLWLTRTYSRSATGGTGAAKCAGNYAAAFAAEREATQHGCSQVLWVDSARGTRIEECGTMNFMAITADDELITPALTGTILPGITRDSLLRLTPDHGLEAVERDITVDELRDGIASGTIREAFACGTAAVITPIVGFEGDDWRADLPPEAGPRTLELREHLVGIQYGTRSDDRGWMTQVC